MDKTKYLIIGAGVSGLSFSKELNHSDFIILEGEKEIGGYCRTIYQGDFIWDYAGHFFHFKTEELKNYFNSKIPSNAIISQQKVTNIFIDGNIVDFPFQKNIHQLPKEKFIKCLYDLYFKESSNIYHSFEDMLYGKFGKEITNLFLKPYNEKLYACDLKNLDVDAMGRFFPHANFEEILTNMMVPKNDSYNNNFLYPKKGAITYINALSDEVPAENIYLNEKLVNVDINKKIGYTSKGREISYEYLINSSPLDSFLTKILNDSNSENKILTSNKVLVFNLGFDKPADSLNDTHWTYIPEKKYNFYRIGFYNHILNHNKLSMYVEIGYNKGEEININEEFLKTIKGLKEIGIISDHILEEKCNLILDPAYVHISKKSENYKKSVFEYLNSHSIYSVGRYGGWKYCSIEDSMIESINLVKCLEK